MDEKLVTDDLLYTTAEETQVVGRQYLAVGLSIIPIKTDGSKAPASDVLPKEVDPKDQRVKPTWKPYQSRYATEVNYSIGHRKELLLSAAGSAASWKLSTMTHSACGRNGAIW